MNFVGRKGGARRSDRAGRRGWVRMIGPVGLVLFITGVALTSVSQNIEYTRASLGLEEARRRHEALLSDLNAQHMKVSRSITMSQLAPEARERLGLIDSSTENMRLVAFDPDVDRALARDPGFLDRLVPEAVARESRSSGTANLEEAVARDQGRP